MKGVHTVEIDGTLCSAIPSDDTAIAQVGPQDLDPNTPTTSIVWDDGLWADRDDKPEVNHGLEMARKSC